MRKLLFVFLILLLQSCSCGSGNGRTHGFLKIGIDPTWYPADFSAQQSYVNGFVEELLLEIARYSGVEFERIPANWDNLLQGMNEKKYDAILSPLPTFSYNKAIYDFSRNFLDLGPVLIVPENVQHAQLGTMKSELVGTLTGDPAVLVLQKYPEIIIRNYKSIPELLNGVVNGEINGAVLNRVPAIGFVRDLYAGKLKIASEPLTDAGLHLVTIKGKNRHLVDLFNKSLVQMQKKKKLNALMKKWELES